jgi:hypothetical protein
MLHNLGGSFRRGDSRWPPATASNNENLKQSDLDNEARRRVAMGTAFRPKRVNRVVRSFMRN